MSLERPNRMRYSPFVLGVFAATLLAGCGQPEFKEYSSPEGKFTVLMPGTPKKQTQQAAGLTIHMFAVELRNAAYIVGYNDLPAGTPANLPGAVQGVAQSHAGSKVLSDKDVMADGNPAREFEISITNPKGYVAGRVTAVQGRLYQILALGSNVRLENAEVRKYLDSFHVTK